MKISDMPTQAEVLAQEMNDPAFRAEWERTALAREVAIAVVRYRTEHRLSQRQLAEQLGWKQPAVARLELGEFNPSFATLCTLSARLGLVLALDITPTGMAFTARSVARVRRHRADHSRALETPRSAQSPRPRARDLVQNKPLVNA